MIWLEKKLISYNIIFSIYIVSLFLNETNCNRKKEREREKNLIKEKVS